MKPPNKRKLVGCWIKQRPALVMFHFSLENIHNDFDAKFQAQIEMNFEITLQNNSLNFGLLSCESIIQSIGPSASWLTDWLTSGKKSSVAVVPSSSDTYTCYKIMFHSRSRVRRENCPNFFRISHSHICAEFFALSPRFRCWWSGFSSDVQGRIFLVCDFGGHYSQEMTFGQLN